MGERIARSIALAMNHEAQYDWTDKGEHDLPRHYIALPREAGRRAASEDDEEGD